MRLGGDFLELQQLRYFKTVAEYQNISKAAEALNLTQPALSRSIKALEEDLGYALFDRKNHRIFLNRYGQTFLKYTNEIFHEINNAQKALADLASSENNTVYLSVSLPEVFMELIERYLARYPSTQIHQPHKPCSTDYSNEQLLLENKVDFCVSGQPIHNPNICWQNLLTEDCYLLVRNDHPLASKEIVEMSDLADIPFIALTDGTELRMVFDQIFDQAKMRPNIAYEVPEAAMLRRMVELGLGSALYPASMWIRSFRGIPEYGATSLCAIPIHSDFCKRNIGIAYAKDAYRSHAAAQFLAFVQEYFQELSQQIAFYITNKH